MIDLTQYEELTKVYKQAQKIDKECDKNFNKAKRINFEEATKNRRNFSEPIRQFQDTIFAETAFNVLLKINPVLIEHRTGKKLKFVEVFGRDFNKLNKSMAINIYIMVCEKSIVYKFKEEVKMVNGQIDEGGDYKRPCQIGFEMPIWRDGKEIDSGYEYGISYAEKRKMSLEEIEKRMDKFELMSQRERAEYMNKNYGMKYKLKNYSDEKPQQQ